MGAMMMFVSRSGAQSLPTAGLQMWLRADAGVDTLNGTVSRWHDQSGNGNDAIQASISRQPLLVAGALNGKPVLRFDGSNDKLGFTGTAHMTQFSLFVVINNHSGIAGNEGNVITFGAAGDITHQWFMGMFFGSDTIRTATGYESHIAATKPGLAAYDQWRNLSVVTTGTVWNTTVRWDGANAQIVPEGSNDSISVPMGDATGSGGGIGGADGVPVGTLLAKCDVAEVIVYGIALSDSVRRNIEIYLASKYGLPQPPIPIVGLQLWLRADAGIDTLNGTVSRWHDQSGNGNDAIQASISRQPLLVAGALNGKPVLRFDGLNDKLGFTGTTHMAQFSLFVVINNHSGIANNQGNVITFGAAGDFDHQWFMGMRHPTGSDTIGMATGFSYYISAIKPGLAAYDEWRNLSVVTTGTVWNTTLRWNGINAQIVPGGLDFAISVPMGDATGSGGGIGAADGVPLGTILAKCDVAEVLVYDVALSDPLRQSIELYLENKYGLVTGIREHQNGSLPEQFVLEQNYPNPFNPSTTIRYGLLYSSVVQLTVFNALGQRVATLVDGEQEAGNHEVRFDATNLASGVYFYRLTAGDFVQSRKLVLLK